MTYEEAFDLEKKRLIEVIKKRNAKSVLIQLPNGLKTHAISLSKYIEENTDAIVYVFGGSCYGGCDLALNEAKTLNIDLIIHYGHTAFSPISLNNLNIVYFYAPFKIDLSSLIVKALKLIKKGKKIGIATTIQHLNYLRQLKNILERNGYKAIIPIKGKHTVYDGQILGCDYSPLKKIENEIDYCLIIGSNFHGLGATICLDKPVILINPYNNEVLDISDKREKILRQRYAYINSAKTSKNIGIIIDTKIGQYKPKMALKLKKLIDENGKSSLLICVNGIVPEHINNFIEIDAFVNTACPRVSIDDATKFMKPVLTPKEFLVSLGKLSWEYLIKQGFL